MLDIFHTEAEYEIQPVHRGEKELAFVSAQPLAAHEEARVVDTKGCSATVLVEGGRRISEGVWIHFGQILEGELEAITPWPEGLREEPRLNVGLRVRSVQLPGYAALTTDISRTGMQIEANESLQVGTVLPLIVDFDDGDDSVNVCGVVRWSQLNAPHRAGLQFVDLAPEDAQKLYAFLNQRDNLERALPSLNLSSRPDADSESGIPQILKLVDAYQEGHRLLLTTRAAEHEVCYEFLHPKVVGSKLQQGTLIYRMESEPVGPQVHRFRWLNLDGEPVLELESTAPNITTRMM
jgi:hypothetical protein